ncbi:hypothetical protein [Paraburkholderia bengalensis]|uniref:hypothetical protein n=1 Tax=Paraburkholderia bengalensis TaxID=2747562 RepID=UPI00301490F9
MRAAEQAHLNVNPLVASIFAQRDFPARGAIVAACWIPVVKRTSSLAFAQIFMQHAG